MSRRFSAIGRLRATASIAPSKFALIGLSDSIRAEFAKIGVDVLVVSPGSTESDFFEHSIGHGRSTPWPTQPRVPAADVARATVRAIEAGKHEIIPNFRGWLLCWLNRLAPRLVDKIMEQLTVEAGEDCKKQPLAYVRGSEGRCGGARSWRYHQSRARSKRALVAPSISLERRFVRNAIVELALEFFGVPMMAHVARNRPAVRQVGPMLERRSVR